MRLNEEKNLEKIDLLFSTFDSRIRQLIDNLPPANSYTSIVIVHQVSHYGDSYECCYKLLRRRGDCNIVVSRTLGVTKSRNIALSHAVNEYVLFCDDDVAYPSDIGNIVRSSFQSEDDAITFRIASTSGGYLRGFSQNSFKHSIRTILSVGTIEIACRRRAVVENSISFPENLGAGTKYPVCDEPVFLSRMLRMGLSIRYVPITIGSHAPLSSGQFIDTVPKLISRLIAFRLIFGNVSGFIIFILFVLKNIKRVRIRQNIIRSKVL